MKKKEKRDFIKEVFGELPEDEKFKEFLAVNKSDKLAWGNDEAAVEDLKEVPVEEVEESLQEQGL